MMDVQSPNFMIKLYCYENVMTSREGLLYLAKVAGSFGQADSHCGFQTFFLPTELWMAATLTAQL